MGQLIYLVGASGSGKDSVMDAVKNRLNSNFPVVFAHRYITKPFALGGENYVSLTEAEFEMRQQAGLFAMSWQSHGYSYGLGVEINFWLEKGFFVVVNGSREYLPFASKLYRDMLVCLIKVSKEKLHERLLGRGRETPEEIYKRLERAESFQVMHPNLKIINNDGSLEESANQFFNIVLDVFQPSIL